MHIVRKFNVASLKEHHGRWKESACGSSSGDYRMLAEGGPDRSLSYNIAIKAD